MSATAYDDGIWDLIPIAISLDLRCRRSRTNSSYASRRRQESAFSTTGITPADRLLVEAKRWGSRLRFAVMLLFFRTRGRFPRAAAEVDEEAVAQLARRLGVPAPGGQTALLPGSDDRTLKRQRAEIRALLGFREASIADAEALGVWLRDIVVARTRDMGAITAEAEARCHAPP